MQTKSSWKGVLGRRDKNDCCDRSFFIFHFRDNLITIWLWCLYLFCFLFSRANWIHVCFCLPISIICLQCRRNLIFYLSNIHLIFSRRLTIFSFFSSSSTRNWLHVNLSFSCKVFSSPTGNSVALISGAAICLFRESWWWRVYFLYVKAELICTLVTRYQSFV